MPDYSSYIAGWKRRRQRERAAIEKRRAHARQVAAQAVDILKQHGATTIILFGSILDHTFDLDSDLDLAVVMPAENWWNWHLRLGEVLDFPIDLVNLKRIKPGFHEIISEFGEVLYDAAKRNSDATSANHE